MTEENNQNNKNELNQEALEAAFIAFEGDIEPGYYNDDIVAAIQIYLAALPSEPVGGEIAVRIYPILSNHFTIDIEADGNMRRFIGNGYQDRFVFAESTPPKAEAAQGDEYFIRKMMVAYEINGKSKRHSDEKGMRAAFETLKPYLDKPSLPPSPEEGELVKRLLPILDPFYDMQNKSLTAEKSAIAQAKRIIKALKPYLHQE